MARFRKDAIAMETTLFSVRRVAASLVAGMIVMMSCGIVTAQDEDLQLTSHESGAANHLISQPVERMELLVKSSRIVTLEARIPRFQVHNEEVINATPVSQNQLQIYAKLPGSTQINLWDTEDKLYTVDVTVVADAREIEGILASQLPLATLRVMPVNASAIVNGYVTSVDDVDRAVAIVEQFYPTVVNNIKVIGVQQVLLHTRIMEVSRTKFRDLGLDFALSDSTSLLANGPGNLINIPQTTVGSVVTTAGERAANARIITGDFQGLITALRQDDLLKFLAEPTVIATHGRPARFTVGGKVPYIVPSGNGAVTVSYEEYGTSVDFLPFVVGPGRIRLEVRPEVKEPDDSRAVTVSGSQVTAFTQRYVETAVELEAGQTFAIAGLLQSRTESTIARTPFLGELPVLGALFRRSSERRNDIELLITVTPEIVDAMDPHEVPRGGPGLNSMSPNDHDFYLNGHIEVPNLLGGDGCSPDSGNQLMGDMTMGGGHGTHYPANTVVPSAEPAMIGDGVMLSSPAN
ncbi:type II and III secretion system protein family protein [Stieleria varia]|uniref:Type II secretion system protein D n=1 Tax=Stieleria varia TaxID=2528005 RepID=A0A5C6ARX6_9BACT|nr:pilus assembly protein N-terminal domain-containing protein [Stieleria varia]TWU02773.1 Type II secretion system protein D precursor [Stieleria varia]